MDVSVTFGGQLVLRGASFNLRAGQIAALTGPNGSGKTTLLNVLSGFLRPHSGSIVLRRNGREHQVLGLAPDRLARLGIARLWQDIRLFPSMSVLDNIMAASPNALGMDPLSALFMIRRVRNLEVRLRERAMSWLGVLGLSDRADSYADTLSVGQAKRVAIARLLQTGAPFLLLDEPLAGLDRAATAKLVDDLKRLVDTTKRALFIVEHNREAILPVCGTHLTLSGGRLAQAGQQV